MDALHTLLLIAFNLLIWSSDVRSDCGCKKLKRILGATSRNGVSFNVDFATIVQQRLTSNMSLIPGGVYSVGTNTPKASGHGESPRREVQVDDFYIDKYEVSNEEFSKFVCSTGYKTDAEKYQDSFVFWASMNEKDLDKVRPYQVIASVPWWLKIPKADWLHPDGPKSMLDEDTWNHPVVHISYYDAVSYCSWLGKRLPTEAEWEIACRGGLKNKLFPWGNQFLVNGTHKANIWQGVFPLNNTEEDGFGGTAPVDRFNQNKYDLHNIIGNVWEWTEDWWAIRHTSSRINPTGPEHGVDKVKKGGSFLCHKDYCYKYRCAARTNNSPDSTASNLGFRCARTKFSS